MPRVEGERIQLLNGITKNLWLGLNVTEVRRAEEFSVIIKLRSYKVWWTKLLILKWFWQTTNKSNYLKRKQLP